jgi:hypothetical protein
MPLAQSAESSFILAGRPNVAKFNECEERQTQACWALSDVLGLAVALVVR